jgi:putative NIF3 family GTP cyclohydrolase 1 type 2
MSAPSVAAVTAWLDHLLDAQKFRGNEPENGLIVDAGQPVRRLGAAVNTSFEAIEAALDAGVDLLLVHHASWPYIDLGLHDEKLARLKLLGISLYCAHASLDGAPDVGTGDSLARLLGLDVQGRFAEYEGALAGVHGLWPGSLDDLVAALVRAVGGDPEVHRQQARCDRVGIVTGAGSLTSWVEEARALGCDTYLTGEGSIYTRLYAKEAHVNLVLAGHYRTEAPGIRTLGERTAEHFEIEWRFVEDDPIG